VLQYSKKADKGTQLGWDVSQLAGWQKAVFWLVGLGVAGALYVPQVGIINPSEMSAANSIEIAIWVAVGGRGTLIGPVIGAFIVNLAKSYFTVEFPEYWLFFLGFLFIGVTLFLPDGVVGLWRKLFHKEIGRAEDVSAPTPPPKSSPPPEPAVQSASIDAKGAAA